MVYSAHFDIAALVITLMVYFYFKFKKTIQSQQNKIFTAFIWVALISNISDLITIYTISNPGSCPRWFDFFINELYLISFNGAAVVYLAYTMYLTTDKSMSLFDAVRLHFPFFIICIMIASTNVSGLIFYFDSDGVYHHGKAFILLYVCAFYYMFSALIQSFVSIRKLNKSQFWTVIFFTTSMLVAITLQMCINGLLIIQFMMAISALVIYLSLENPENYINKLLNTYNNMAFIQVFESYVQRDKKFGILGIEIDGFKYINENLGVMAGNQLMSEVAEFLKDVAGRKSVFHMAGAQFAIMSSDTEEDWDKIIEKIRRRFKENFVCMNAEIVLNPHMCYMTYPNVVGRIEDAMGMMEYSFKQSKASSENEVIYANTETVSKGKRENRILHALSQAIREDGFTVLYQPIYSVKEERYTTAEALVRLKNTDIGFVGPDEFIPLAEKNGMIVKIGEIVFDKVCRFYTENHLDELGIETIHFNLSVVECMQQKLHDKIKSMMDRYELDYSRISLEITETAAVASKETLVSNMQQLINTGFKFSMDDYGTGFSNTSTIINYPFEEIKIDKSIVWSAMEDEKAMIAFKHSVAMIKELNFKIVAEGVENEEQAKLLKELGCDYFQGYYYSKPLDGEIFRALLAQ